MLGGKIMAKKNETGRIFVKVMAAILAVLMVLAVSATLIFYLINQKCEQFTYSHYDFA